MRSTSTALLLLVACSRPPAPMDPAATRVGDGWRDQIQLAPRAPGRFCFLLERGETYDLAVTSPLPFDYALVGPGQAWLVSGMSRSRGSGPEAHVRWTAREPGEYMLYVGNRGSAIGEVGLVVAPIAVE
jgi:hypothetical protein